MILFQFYKALTSDEAALTDQRLSTSHKQNSNQLPINHSWSSSEIVHGTSNISSNQSVTGKSKTAHESAYTALQAMRKATCLSAVSETER